MSGRSNYVRFVTTNLNRSSGRREGIFQAAANLKDAPELGRGDSEELEAMRKWSNKNLQKPDRFSWSQKSRPASVAISWFKDTAVEHIRRVRCICRILNEQGVSTEMITSDRPGYIVFEDEHQIAAVPFAETGT